MLIDKVDWNNWKFTPAICSLKGCSNNATRKISLGFMCDECFEKLKLEVVEDAFDGKKNSLAQFLLEDWV